MTTSLADFARDISTGALRSSTSRTPCRPTSRRCNCRRSSARSGRSRWSASRSTTSRARPGTGTTSPAANTPARTSTHRCTGSRGKDHADNTVDTIDRVELHRAGRGRRCQRRSGADPDWLLTVDFLEAWEDRARPHPRRRLGAAAHRLVQAPLRPGRLREPARRRRPHARPDAGSGGMADPRAQRARLRRRDDQHRCGSVVCLAGGLPLPHADARREPVRPAVPEEPGPAAAARRGDRRRAAEDPGRLGQPLRVLALVQQ